VAASEPDAAASWLADPDAAPHGGESLAALVRRVGGWMDSAGLSGHVLAVTHPAVIRAALVYALGAPTTCFWRIDIAPLSLTKLRRNATQWSLRFNRPPFS
jgi:broad specificity phosphatase PhoE